MYYYIFIYFRLNILSTLVLQRSLFAINTHIQASSSSPLILQNVNFVRGLDNRQSMNNQCNNNGNGFISETNDTVFKNCFQKENSFNSKSSLINNESKANHFYNDNNVLMNQNNEFKSPTEFLSLFKNNTNHDFWIINGETLIINNVPMFVSQPMGIINFFVPSTSLFQNVTIEKEDTIIEGSYNLVNDIYFILKRVSNNIPKIVLGYHNFTQSDHYTSSLIYKGLWEVHITQSTHRTIQAGDDDVLETTIKNNFLHNNALLHIYASPTSSQIYVSVIKNNGERINNENSDIIISSIELIPAPSLLPFFLKHSHLSLLEDQQTDKIASIPGYWDITIHRFQYDVVPSTIQLSLKITALPIVSAPLPMSETTTTAVFACLLEGFNIHTFRFQYNLETSEVFVGLISSTDLEVMDEYGAWEERKLINALSLSTKLIITDANTLIFSSESNEGIQCKRSVSYFSGVSYFPTKPSYWVWIPQTLIIGGNTVYYHKETNVSMNPNFANQQIQDGNVIVLELWKSIVSETIVFDVYINGNISYRVTLMPTAGDQPLMSIHQLNSKSTTFQANVLNFLKQLKSIDLHMSHEKQYITLLGTNSSLSFDFIPSPPEGLWIFVNNYNIEVEEPSSTRRVSLKVFQHANKKFYGILTGTVSVYHFEFNLESVLKGSKNWSVSNIAARRQRKSLVDEYLANFFTNSNIVAEIQKDTSKGIEKFLLINKNNNETLLFVHPIALTIPLTGYWALQELNYKNSNVLSSIQTSNMHNIKFALTLWPVANTVGQLKGKLEITNTNSLFDYQSYTTYYSIALQEHFHLTPYNHDNATINSYNIEVPRTNGSSSTIAFIPHQWSLQCKKSYIADRNALNFFVNNEENFLHQIQNLVSLYNHNLTKEFTAIQTSTELTHVDQDINAFCNNQQTNYIDINLSNDGLKIEMQSPMGFSAIFEKSVDAQMQQLITGKWNIQFILDTTQTASHEDSMIIANDYVWKNSKIQLYIEPTTTTSIDHMKIDATLPSGEQWKPQYLKSYDVKTYNVSLDGQQSNKLADWKILINPSGAIFYTNINNYSKHNQESTLPPLEKWLITYLRNNDQSIKTLELSKSELIISDEKSMIALLRSVDYEPFAFPQEETTLMMMIVQGGTTTTDEGSRYANQDFSVMEEQMKNQSEQMSFQSPSLIQVTKKNNNNDIFDELTRTTSLVNMLKRRLEAEEQLNIVLAS